MSRDFTAMHRAYARRVTLVALATALLAALSVMVLHKQFHDFMSGMLGFDEPFGDAIGCVFVVLASFAAQFLLSELFFKDMSFGMAKLGHAEADVHESTLRATTERVASELASFPDFNRVVHEQLNAISTETEKSALNIMQSLQKVDTNIVALEGFVSVSSNESTSRLLATSEQINQNNKLIGEMRDYIQRRIDLTTDDQIRVNQVVKEARSLESLVDLIKHIAGQTNLLSLNAAIEAARAGEYGRGFAVVADEVRKLSGQTEQAVAQVRDGIQTVATTIEKQFQDQLSEARNQNEILALEMFSKQLTYLGDRYSEMVQHEAMTLARIVQSNDDLSRMFMDVMASIQFQDVTRQQVEHVLHALDRLNEHVALLCKCLSDPHSPCEIKPLAQHLDEMFDGYVMDSQRSQHNQAMHRGSATSGARPKVELF